MGVKEELTREIECIGLTRNESLVYLSLLDNGPCKAGCVAKTTKIQRTNVYDALARLMNKGLAGQIENEGTRMFDAGSPELLKDLLLEKQEKADRLVPLLRKRQANTGRENKATMLEGIKGIRAVLQDILSSLEPGDEVVTYGNPKDTSYRMRGFIGRYHNERISKGIRQYHIYNQDAQERLKQLREMKYTFARHLAKDYDSKVATTVYGDRVSFFVWQDQAQAMIIQNKEFAESYKRYYWLLWKEAIE